MALPQRPRGRIVAAAVASMLTLGGGIGYAVQRLRAQHAKRDSAAQDNFLAAVTMLASQHVHERVAAVHALAGIADSDGAEYRQRVVDVLCGYLRTERSFGEGEAGASAGSIAFADAPVESTIVSVIASHVCSGCPADTSWSEYSFDWHGAVIHERCAS